MGKLVDLEYYIESFKERQFFKGSFRFDPLEQKKITSRIILEIRGKHNIIEQTVLALRIPYLLTKE